MSHGGAHEPGTVVDQDLICIDLMIVQVVDLSIDEVYSRTGHCQHSVPQGYPPVHVESPGPA